MLYQIQTKYRDEARPRAGLIRVREFTMKDGYSFHASEACLLEYYDQAHAAYERIFNRVGMTNVLSIESDSGMMGGSISHEFMAIADCGEDTLFVSPDRAYRANKEIATTALTFTKDAPKSLEKVHTPNHKTIEEVASFLGTTIEQTGKAVFYVDHEERLVFACIRGDLEVNEAKLKKAIQSPTLDVATEDQIRAAGAVPGYASTLGLDPEHAHRRRSQCRTFLQLGRWGQRDRLPLHPFQLGAEMPPTSQSTLMSSTSPPPERETPAPVTGAPLRLHEALKWEIFFNWERSIPMPWRVTF